MLKWSELIVTDSDGNTGDTLGSMVELCSANLDTAVLNNGRIVEWPGFILSAPGEEPDWDTPRGPVDWDGFMEALAAK